MAFKVERFISPLKLEEDPKVAKDIKGFDEQFEIVKAKYPESTVTKRKNKLGSYTIRTGGSQFMYTPGKPAN
jgi:hypothetical protein